jgi:hypothetical protein
MRFGIDMRQHPFCVASPFNGLWRRIALTAAYALGQQL